MGAKGLQTRRRLIATTEELLKTTPLRDLRASDIAKAAEASTATFYLYFRDVPEAVLAVVSELSQSPPSFLSIVGRSWPEADAYDLAQHFVEIYFEYWEAHGALLRVRNLAADEGDERFGQARFDSVTPLMRAMADRIDERKAAGALPSDLHSWSTAGALLAMIERIAVVPHAKDSEYGVTREKVVHAAAFFTAVVLGGRASVGDLHPTDA
jgi:AcrR family transcriptional regulator